MSDAANALQVGIIGFLIIICSFIGSFVLFTEREENIYKAGFEEGYGECYKNSKGWYNPISKRYVPASFPSDEHIIIVE